MDPVSGASALVSVIQLLIAMKEKISDNDAVLRTLLGKRAVKRHRLLYRGRLVSSYLCQNEFLEMVAC